MAATPPLMTTALSSPPNDPRQHPLPSPPPSAPATSQQQGKSGVSPPEAPGPRRFSDTAAGSSDAALAPSPRTNNLLAGRRSTVQLTRRPSMKPPAPQLSEKDDHRPIEVKVRSRIANHLYGNNYVKLASAVDDAAEAGLPEADPYLATARAVLSLSGLKRDVRNMCSTKRTASLPLLRKAAYTVAGTSAVPEKKMQGAPSLARVRKSREVQESPAFKAVVHSMECLEQDMAATVALQKNDIAALEKLHREALRNENAHTAARLEQQLKRLQPQYDWQAEFERKQMVKKLTEREEQAARLKALRAEEQARKREQRIVHSSWTQDKKEREQKFISMVDELRQVEVEREWQRQSLEPQVTAAKRGLERCWVDNFATRKPWTPSLTGPDALPHMYKRVECRRCNPVEWRLSHDVTQENVPDLRRTSQRLEQLEAEHARRAWRTVDSYFPTGSAPASAPPARARTHHMGAHRSAYRIEPSGSMSHRESTGRSTLHRTYRPTTAA
eukprot:jgi/Tetstr1/453367/TSEL_040356.t1